MITAASFINTLLFVGIALLHIYWAFGGKRWLDVVLPDTGEHGKKVFVPGPIITMAVAAGILLFAFVSLAAAPFLAGTMPVKWIVYGNAAIVVIFALRAMGDFRYAGFFKKIKHTPFGKNDSTYYSPLCMAIALLALVIVLTLKSNI
jgi:Protein of unknown function (DUF3995)